MNFKKILSCILCFFVTISASLPPAKAVDAATVLIVTGLLQGVQQGLTFIFDKGGKIQIVPEEEIYDIIRDMKCERCKNENNQIKAGRTKAGSQKYKCKHYGAVFKIFVHVFVVSRFI